MSLALFLFEQPSARCGSVGCGRLNGDGVSAEADCDRVNAVYP